MSGGTKNVNGFQNRECANCLPPCTGGEVLHRRGGACCKPFCLCMGFEPKAHVFHTRPPLQDALAAQVKRRRLGTGPVA